jgi:hypothetical protein
MLETLAISIAELSFEVSKKVEGYLSTSQVSRIAQLLEEYKSGNRKPSVADYLTLTELRDGKMFKQHKSDYYLKDKATSDHFLIELKIGGDLDNKKARSEKEALFEQFAILTNSLPPSARVQCFFATGYNRYGEGKPWVQSRVLQFFSIDELLIGKEFWNFVSKLSNGYEIVLEEYKRHAHHIKTALNDIKSKYLT